MKIAVRAGLPAERNMYVNSCHIFSGRELSAEAQRQIKFLPISFL
jgi:hypothetical protein